MPSTTLAHATSVASLSLPDSCSQVDNEFALRTSRLVLRPPVPEDAESLWPFVTDSRVTEFLAWEPHTDLKQTVGMIESLRVAQQSGRGFHWVICIDGQVSGLISLIDVHRTHRCWMIDRAELAYWVGPTYQQRGLATEASDRVLRFAFERLGFHRIVVYHAAQNCASGKIPMKLGFRYVGEHREAFQKDGKWHSLKQYELLRSDYRERDGVHNYEA